MINRIDITHEILQSTETLSLKYSDKWCPVCKKRLYIPLDYRNAPIEIAGTEICTSCKVIWVIKHGG